MYWGGPFFKPINTNFTILEKYSVVNKVATILFHFGDGLVILTGLHHEWVSYNHSEWQKANWYVLEIIIKKLLHNETHNNVISKVIEFIPLVIIGTSVGVILLLRIFYKADEKKAFNKK